MSSAEDHISFCILHSALFHVNSEIRIHMKQIPLHLRLLWWTAAVFVPQSSEKLHGISLILQKRIHVTVF